MILRIAKSVLIFLAAFAAVSSYALMPKNSRGDFSERPLPFSAEAERSVLGAVLLDNGAMLKVMPILREKDLFLDQHKRIYSRMTELFSSGKPIDLVTLTECLDAHGELEAAGGPAYLSQLMDGLPRATNVQHYGHIVLEKAKLRSIIYASETIREWAFGNPPHDLESLSSYSADDITEAAICDFLDLTGERQESKIREWNEAADSAISAIDEARKNPKSVCRINSGIAGLDDMTAGLRKKEISLIIGGSSHGKSLLGEQFSVTADDDNYQGMIFSAEMSAESIVMRELSYESDVFLYHMRRPDTVTEERFENLKLAARRERKISIVDSGITPERVWVLAEARKRSKGLDFVVVDYDQLVVGAGMASSADPDMFFARQGEFIIRAAEFAKRLDIAFILLAQPRKMPPGMKKGEKPMLDDIYGHSAMRNTPHVVMWIVREFFVKGFDKKYERRAKVYVMKSRNDRTGHVDLEFDPQRVRFLDKKSGEESEEI